MSITAYEYLSILQAQDTGSEQKKDSDSFDYQRLLEKIRTIIAEKHSKELSFALGSPRAAKTLKTLILKYCVQELAGKEYDQEKLVDKIYQDMAGLGILTDYLYDSDVEEININGYNMIEINYPDHIKYLYDKEAFPSPTAALDIIKRMVRMGGMILDSQTPRVDSYTSSGTRISAMIPPLFANRAEVRSPGSSYWIPVPHRRTCWIFLRFAYATAFQSGWQAAQAPARRPTRHFC